MECYILFVRYDHYGIARSVYFLEEVHDIDRSLGVKIPRGFIGKQKGGPIHQGSSHCDALPLPARELVGLVVHSVGQSYAGQRVGGAFCALMLAHARVDERELHIL